MKLFFVWFDNQWYIGHAVDEYKVLTLADRLEALNWIEAGWPVEYANNKEQLIQRGHTLEAL